jgi:phytoene dehydrogenase-like protein
MAGYDAIVIGAGHNGLTCACYLAKAGISVLVLEQYPQIGGLTRSEELTLPGFVSDAHAYAYQLAHLSPAPLELDLARHGFALLHPDPNWVHSFPDGRSIAFWRDVDETCRSIAECSRKDADTWRRLYDEHLTQRDGLIAALNAEPAVAPISAERRQTLRSWCDERFESEALRATFGAWACHVSLSPDDEGSAGLAHDFAMVIQSDGNDVVQGGMQRLADALASALAEHGGEIRTSARVERILVDNGRALGVRLCGGEEIRCRAAIAANANPARVILDLLDAADVGPSIASKMRRYRWGLGALSVFLALDGSVDYRAGPDAGRATYVHPSPPTLDYFSAILHQARQGTLAAQPFVLAANEAAVDPSRAPAGRSLMKLVLQPVPFRIVDDATGAISSRTWETAAGPYADYVIQAFERDYAPGLRNSILTRKIRDPFQELALGFDTVNGCMTHGAMIPAQSGASRPIPELGRYRTPVANVYLCGAGTHPGGGVSMMPGRNAARAICSDLGLDAVASSAPQGIARKPEQAT